MRGLNDKCRITGSRRSTSIVANSFKCPNCDSGRTKPLSIAVSSGTRRRRTLGLSTRSLWSSQSTYKSDFVSQLPERPSNRGAYLLIFLGAFGLWMAWQIGTSGQNAGLATVLGLISALFLLGGIVARKSGEKLLNEK